MTWRVMHLRCTDPHHRDYARFGGRGIRVCPDWDDFATFMADLGPRPSPAHRLARRDESADFTPENCLWANHTERHHLQRAQPAPPATPPDSPALATSAGMTLPAPTVPSTTDHDGTLHPEDAWLSVSAAAQTTGLSRATIRHWVHGGKLPATQRGGLLAVRLADVVAARTRHHCGSVLPAWRAEPARCGARLRAFREAADLSQRALAAASGLTNAAISLLEHGGRAPAVATVRLLADALKIAPERFVSDDPLGLSMLSAAEAAARLDVPLERLQIWLKEGQLPGTKVSGRWRVPTIAVVELERSGRLRGRSRRLDPRYRV
jgi:excisionase family DNA binding protein